MCFDLAHAAVATSARAAATGPVSMSTRPDPEDRVLDMRKFTFLNKRFHDGREIRTCLLYTSDAADE